MTKEDVNKLFTDSKTDIIRTLARNGFGGLYAEEIVLRTNISKDKPAAEINEEELNSLYETINHIFNPLKSGDFNPQIVSEGKDDVLPLNLKSMKNMIEKPFPVLMKLQMNSTVA